MGLKLDLASQSGFIIRHTKNALLEFRCLRLDKEGVAEAIILNLLNGVSMRGRGRYPFFHSFEKGYF